MDYLDESMIKTYNSSEDFLMQRKKNRVILMTTKASKSYIDFKFKNGDTLYLEEKALVFLNRFIK